MDLTIHLLPDCSGVTGRDGDPLSKVVMGQGFHKGTKVMDANCLRITFIIMAREIGRVTNLRFKSYKSKKVE